MKKSKKTRLKKKRIKKVEKIDKGIVHIHSTFNNTLISLTDEKGNLLDWVSAGSLGFKGTKKGTPYAAAATAQSIIEKAEERGIKEVQIKVKGIGTGRDSALRSFVGSNFLVTSIKDVTPLPHGGPRPKKQRRV